MEFAETERELAKLRAEFPGVPDEKLAVRWWIRHLRREHPTLENSHEQFLEVLRGIIWNPEQTWTLNGKEPPPGLMKEMRVLRTLHDHQERVKTEQNHTLN